MDFAFGLPRSVQYSQPLIVIPARHGQQLLKGNDKAGYITDQRVRFVARE